MRGLSFCGVLLVGLAVGCSGASTSSSLPKSAASPLLEHPLPEFRRDALDGTQVKSAELSGRVVVVKFFAKYCKPCMKTLPATQTLAHERTDVTFLGISVDERESDAREMVSQYGLTFPVVFDRGGVLAGRFRISELPATFVVGKSGRVTWVGKEGVDENTLAAAIDAASQR
ncbi:MAG: TlpA disulfide reductase family protein [Polyangiaceae bacterium]